MNYDPLVPAQPTNVSAGKVEVVEVFWLGCPHCYALEPFIQSWVKSKPAYIEFVRVPVMWGPVHRAHARFFYTLQALNRTDLFEKAFDTIQQQHNPAGRQHRRRVPEAAARLGEGKRHQHRRLHQGGQTRSQ